MVFKQKMVKISSRALLRIRRKHTTFSTFLSKRAFVSNFFTCFELLQQRLRTCQGQHPCQIIPCGTHSFFLRARTSYTKLASRECYHNKSLYTCASGVATVVRTPRSEVSQRHRAGSWVWVVAKSRLDIW